LTERRVLVIGLVVALSLVISSSPSDLQGFQLKNINSSLVTTVHVNKPMYFIAEPIIIQLSFYNPTSSPVSITGPNTFPFCIEIRQGDEILLQWGHGAGQAFSTFTIESQETFTFDRVYDPWELGPEYYLSPGLYEVHGYFYDGSGGRLEASVFIVIGPTTVIHAALIILVSQIGIMTCIIWYLQKHRKKS
jgi:hypothetical protein